jgi:hypothetical protein
MPGHLDIRAIRTFKELNWNEKLFPVFDILLSQQIEL